MTKLNPENGSIRRSSMSSIMVSKLVPPVLSRSHPLQLQPYIHEIVGRPRTRVLEFQALAIFFGDGVDRLIELGLAIAFHQKSRIHDHLVTDRLVVARSHAHAAQCLINLPHISDRA